MKKIKKIFAWVSILSLVLQISGGIFVYRPVLAEEEATPTPEITPSTEPTLEPTPTIEPAPSAEPAPSIEPEATAAPTPTEEITPALIIEDNQPASENSAPPSETGPPTPTVNPEQPEQGRLAAVILENVAAYSLELDLATEDIEQSASLVTDKADYAPTDTVFISGSGFNPNETYTLIISSTDEPPVNFETQVIADENGSFVYAYQLDGNYRPNYKVEAKDGEIVIATTTFTDSRTTVSATLNGSPSVTVAPGASITAAVTGTLTSDDNWKGTQWRISTTAPGSMTCENTGNHSNNNTYTETFSITAPNTPGTYNAYFRISGENNCGSQQGSLLTLTDAVTVQVVQPVLNPTLSQSCGIDIGLVIDTSTSIENDELAVMKTAFNGFISAFTGTPTRMAVVSFDDSAVIRSGFTSDLASLNTIINGINGDGYTNWEDVLLDTRGLFPDRADKPDLIVFTSDGNPTASNTGGSNDTGQPNAHLAPAITQANLAKAAGIRIITLGIGGDVSQSRLEQISSADAYYSAATFDTLDETLEQLVTSLCGGTITVTKLIDADGSLATTGDQTPAGGWSFNIGGVTKVTNASDGKTDAVTLTAGSYSVIEAQQAGYPLVGATCTGGADGDNGIRDGNLIDSIQVSNTSIVSCTFINTIHNSSIFGKKFNDLNGNGTLDSGEPGLQNWTINLYKYDDQGNNPVFSTSTTTDANGDFTFTNVEPGIYKLAEVNQAGWHQTAPIDFFNISVVKGQDVAGYYFGNQRNTGTITVDKVTVPSSDQTNFPFTVVSIEAGFNQSFNLADQTTPWSMTLPTGVYTVSEGTLPAGWTMSNLSCISNQNPITNTFDLDNGENVTCTFTNTKLGSITIVKNTIGGDGQFSFDSGQLPGPGFGITTSGNTGSQSFNNLTPGSFTVYESTSSGWDLTNLACTDPDGGSTTNLTDKYVSIDLDAGESVTCTFTNTLQYGSITAHKFADFDKSGVQDAGEPNVAYFQMSLYQGNGCSGSPISQLDTQSDGNAVFSNLIAGDYSIKETLPTPGDPGTGWWTNISPLCQNVHVDYGQNQQVNFANFRVQQLTVCKYNDINGDGHWLPGDNPLSGWTINLSGPENLTGVTGGDGCARIPVNIYGGYVVTEILQPGWLQTFPSEPQTAYADYSYSTGLQLYNFQLGIISGQKFNDLNKNGVKDSGELGLSGWTINLDKDIDGSVDFTTITDSSGDYSFTNLLAGTYRVREVIQTGWVQTSTNPADVTITSGSNVAGLDFGNVQQGRIIIEKQILPDGSAQPFEFDPSWSVANFNLTDGETNDSGWLAPGAHAVSETNPSTSGYRLISIACDDANSTGDVLTGTATFNVEPGETVKCTFTNEMFGSITAHKYEDLNAGGTQDAGEPDLSGWTMSLYSGSDCQGNLLQQHGTDSSGEYTFYSIVPGQPYSVGETLQTGWINISPLCQNISITPGEQKQVEFGNIRYGWIALGKCNDLNGDGGECDGSEPMLPGWTLFLDENNDGILNGSERSGVTDSQGMVNFSNVLPRSYGLCEVQQSGWISTKQASNCLGVSLNPGGGIVYYFANFKLGIIQSRKYEDLNNDSTRDSGEPYLNGWTIRLYKQGEGWQLVDTKITGDTGIAGQYRFENLGLGTYYLCEALQAGWTQTDPRAPEGFANQSVAGDEASRCRRVIINQSGAESIGEKHFGNVHYGKITVCKYDDYDGDGNKDENEPGIDGVSINVRHLLPDGQANELSLDGVTGDGDNPQGCFTFENLIQGNYRVSEDLNDLLGYTPTSDGDDIPDGVIEVTVTPGQTTLVNFFNQLQRISLDLTKSNTVSGSTITYTLTVHNTSLITAHNVKVKDMLPFGFTYKVGTTKINDVSAADPTIFVQLLTWDLGDMTPDQTIVLTFETTIGSLPMGIYPNLAFVLGADRDPCDPAFCTLCYSDFAYSLVTIGWGFSTTTHIGGTILGASTTLPQVLGAATGSETYWLVLALIMILTGVSLMILIDKKKKALLLKKLAKISKKLSAFSFFVFLVSCFFIFAGGARATNDSLFIRVADLPEYKNTDSFKLYYTALEREEKPISVDCYVEKDGGFGWKTFGGTQTEPSGSCEVFGYELEGDATYRFKAIASSIDGSTESNITQTKIDRSGPEAPKDYRKSRESSTAYKIHWKNPGNDDYGWTRIFASTTQNFTADDATKKADVGGGKDVEFDYLVTGLEPNQDYYFALQGFDKAGNSSGLAGDGGTVTYEVTPAPTQTVAGVGEAVTLPKEEAQEGEILGGATEAPTPTEAPVSEGVVAGITSQVGGMNKGLLATGAGILIILAGLGYYFYRRSS